MVVDILVTINGGNTQSARMERQGTAAKTLGAETIFRRTENRCVSPGRNASYVKMKGYQAYHTVHPQNTARGGSVVPVVDNMIHHEEAKYARTKSSNSNG
jgi:hypothetical protein